ncbi:MAG: hypothetical protein DMF62_05425 [Acidobacteria bacterium]|nr:MAG: hypothetical protein DMF62_05425 [Acidobacteriota bacterium]
MTRTQTPSLRKQSTSWKNSFVPTRLPRPFYGFVNGHTETGTSINGCVGFFDIDDLKGINDCFGHAAGDLAIRSVVRAIREIIRAEDLIYRWGATSFS